MNHKVVSALPKVKLPTSFATHSHGVTGGVYKARERIHRSILIYDYWRFRLHGVELQTPIRTTTYFVRSACSREFASLCICHCSTCVALLVRAMMTCRHPHLPPVYHRQSPLSSHHYVLATNDKGCARCGT